MRRIERQPYRIGSGNNADPEAIEELQERRDKHERLTRGKPVRAFGSVLKDRMKKLRGDQPEEEAEDENKRGARDPLLGLDPNQDSAIANRPEGKRAGKVIVKG